MGKFIITFQIIFSLLFTSLNVLAKADLQNHSELNDVRSLISEYILMTKGTGHEELINRYGEKWLQKSNSLLSKIKNNKNKEILQSPEGQSLLKSTGLLTNYLTVKKHFDQCIKDKENQRQLSKRTLQVILQNEKEANPCTPMIRGFQNFQDFYKNNMQAIKNFAAPHFENEIKKQVLTNSLMAFFRFERKFDPKRFIALNKNTENEMKSLINLICTPPGRTNSDQCAIHGNEFKDSLLAKMKEASPFVFAEKKYSPEMATKEINDKLGRLNTFAKKVSLDVDRGFFYDSPKEIDAVNREHFDNYIQEYLKAADDGAGVLLLTEKIKDQGGGLRSLDENLVKNKKLKAFKIEPHYVVNQNQTKKAIDEVREKMMAQVVELDVDKLSVFSKPGTNQNIDQLSAANPFAVGQILARDPSYAALACDSFNRIADDDKFNAKLDKAFFVGTAVLSGALILTGVGAVAGSYLLTGSLTAGIAAGTVGGSVIAGTALVGTATELASAAYYGSRAIDEARDLERIERAIYTGGADHNSVQSTKCT